MTVMPTEPHPAADALLERWNALLERCGATADPEPYGRALLARWAEPQRRYHTTDHLLAVLDEVDALAEHAADPDAVRLAAWFHDAVYKPDRSENEERSAQLAIRALDEAGLPAALVAEVVRLVRLTVGHRPRPGDRDGEVLCDADLAVLGRSPQAYARYAAAVREEYAFVPEAAFRQGRAAILRQLLALPALYRTPAAHARYDGPARANLAAELAELSEPAP
ncbi:putative metal-dependent HD superfamily phosphohydrolase [Kitasatospora sp. GAS204A]|uniref:HD domain-containing protein n=2 Tax=Kitasatospora TaxID=2063 RepID=UPI00247BE5EB|nr:putative metal-dependent HD superfamily phosphohydrolase [Kitasatospora sp. GAS204B]